MRASWILIGSIWWTRARFEVYFLTFTKREIEMTSSNERSNRSKRGRLNGQKHFELERLNVCYGFCRKKGKRRFHRLSYNQINSINLSVPVPKPWILIPSLSDLPENLNIDLKWNDQNQNKTSLLFLHKS